VHLVGVKQYLNQDVFGQTECGNPVTPIEVSIRNTAKSTETKRFELFEETILTKLLSAYQWRR
jgi:hypothetical protein